MGEEHREESLQAVRVEQFEARGAAENGDAAFETREQAATNERAPQQPARTRVPGPGTAHRHFSNKRTLCTHRVNIRFNQSEYAAQSVCGSAVACKARQTLCSRGSKSGTSRVRALHE